MKRIFITAAITLAAIAAQAQTDSVYTLSECTAAALENNATMRMTDNELRAAIETRREAFTKYFPDIQAGFSAFWTHHKVFEYNVLDLFTIGLIHKGRATGIWATQPVFAGGRIVNGNKLARVGEEAARIKKEAGADQVTLETESIYWQLVTLKATRRTVVSALEMLDSLHRQVSAAVDAGLVVRNDLLKVDLKRNSYRADLIDLDNGIALMRMLLGQQMGMGADARPDIAEVVPDSVPPFPEKLFMTSDAALSLNTDRQLLEKNAEAKELERRIEVGKYLPEVGVEAGWVFHNIFEQNHNFGALMVTISVPLSGWWGGSHAIRRKALEAENARTELTNLSQKIRIEMTDKWDNLTAAHRKMRLAAEAEVQSRENLRITRAYYDAGMNTITDLLDAQTLHRQAQDDYIASYGKFRLSRAQYLQATGRLRR